MAIEKEINARIQNKHDIATNWNDAADFIPKAGEFIVYDADVESTSYPRVKIGDGYSKINSLPFIDDHLLEAISNIPIYSSKAAVSGGTDVSLVTTGEKYIWNSYANQNAFSNITVGSTTIAADSITDTLTLVAGSNIIITPNAANDKVTFSVPPASGTEAGVTIVYPAEKCTDFSSDSGTVTPLAVQKGAKMFAITRPTSVTDKAITRYNGTDGSVQNSKIIIEDVTNSRDGSKKANVLAIPAEGGKKMVYGYCTDQVDGTSFIGGLFSANATEYPYNEGLAIGGTSGNLLWKGNKIITINDPATTSTAGVMSAADKIKVDSLANTYLAKAGDTMAGAINMNGNNISGAGTVQAAVFSATSDARLKTNIIPYQNSNSILNLPIYQFDFIDGPQKQIGCLAQDLQKICPELVADRGDGFLAINETKLIYLLLGEIKRLDSELNKLKKEG